MAVRTEEEVRRLLKLGEERRKVGGTDWNARSSRSHCVFRVVSEQPFILSNLFLEGVGTDTLESHVEMENGYGA